MSHTVSFGSAISIAFILGMAALPAIADIHHEGEYGSLTFGGDVELDINAQNTHAGQGPIFFEDDVEQGDEFNQTGRVLVELGDERRGPAGHYARFRVQPLLQTSGGFGLDDTWLVLGSPRGLELKVGRFEAYDLFPKGQDVFVGFSGETSDGLYRDGQGYVYQAREGRGRGGDSGQVLLSQRSDDVYAEVATLFGDRRDLFDTSKYHDYAIESDDDAKDSFFAILTVGGVLLSAGQVSNDSRQRRDHRQVVLRRMSTGIAKRMR